MAVRKLNPVARSRILLHPCQRSLSFTANILPVVETTLVK